MFIGVQHRSTQAQGMLCRFDCRYCEFEGPARVVGIGDGGATSAYFLDNAASQRKANTRAAAAAVRNGERTLSLARCPECGRRRRLAVLAFWGKTSMMLLLSALMQWAIGAYAFVMGVEFAPYLFGPMGLLVPFVIAYHYRWQWNTVDERVGFIRGTFI